MLQQYLASSSRLRKVASKSSYLAALGCMWGNLKLFGLIFERQLIKIVYNKIGHWLCSILL